MSVALRRLEAVPWLCSKSQDAALAGMAVKVMQLERLLQGKQAELQRLGDTGRTWVEEACHLRDAVASTLAALGTLSPPECKVLLAACQDTQFGYSTPLSAPSLTHHVLILSCCHQDAAWQAPVPCIC